MFSAPGPMQTSTPGPSTPNEKQRLKPDTPDEAPSLFSIQLTSALTSRMTSEGDNGQRSPDYLPDACLSEIAQGVGNDWRHLANQLRISVSEELRHRPGNTAELAVLRAWRDRHLERPSEALDQLRRALATLKRTDLLKILDFYVRDARRSESDREGPKLVSTV